MVLRHKEKVTAIRAAHLSLLEAQVRLIEAKSDVLLLQEKNVEIHQRLEDEKRSLEEMEGSQEELRRKAKKALDAVKAVPEEIWDQSRMIELGKDKSVADIDSDIHAETTRLDVIEAGNPHALDEFEKRATDIERLRREKGRREHELRDLRAEIEELRGRWEPRLDELIGRINDAFSHNFEQISCAGEVGVHKDEDFDKWAIEIKVKFRYIPPFSSFPQLPLKTESKHIDTPTARTRRSKNSTSTDSPAASARCRPSSTSCRCSPWPRLRSGSWTRSIRVWTRATNAWFTSAWWRSPAASTRASISSSHQNSSPACATTSA